MKTLKILKTLKNLEEVFGDFEDFKEFEDFLKKLKNLKKKFMTRLGSEKGFQACLFYDLRLLPKSCYGLWV